MPHLVFERAARNRIARAQRAIGVDHHLGDDEQRDALGRFGCIGGLGEDQVDDVFGQVVLARRDEDLGPGDRIRPVGARHRAGADQAQIGAAMRLGQVHRPEPLARNHFRDVKRLLPGAALGEIGRAHV